MKSYKYFFLGLFVLFLSIYFENLLMAIGGVLIVSIQYVNKLHYSFFKKNGNILYKLFNHKN